MVTSLLGLVIFGAIGCCFGHWLDGFLLWLLVLPLRKNAGGYHATTRGRCILLSTSMLILFFVLFYYVGWSDKINFIVVLCSGSVIFFGAPVENEAKRLDEKEQSIYRKRARIILMAECLLYVIAVIFHVGMLKRVLTMCFGLVAMSVLVGKVNLTKSAQNSCAEKREI